MSEQNHTPEPWSLCEVENHTGNIKHLVPVDSEKLSILTLVENDQATFAAIYNDADAHRTVACINACSGIPTELLEDSKCWAGAGIETATSLRKQRDELLAVLKRAETAMEICSDWLTEIEMPDGWTTTTDEKLKISDAIASAKGSKND